MTLLAVVLVGLLAVPAVLADGEPRLRDSVTDEAGVLSAGDVATLTDALGQLRADENVQLFVAFVRTTGSQTVTEFTQATAETNSLGGNDALLLVAMEDRSDALWVGPSLDEVTDAEIDGILSDAVEPRLADGDPAGAVIAGIAALRDALAVVAPPTAAPATPAPTAAPATPAPTTPPDAGGASGGGLDLGPVLAVLLVVGGVFLVGRTILVRRANAREAAAERDRLSKEANRALLATDEAVRDADQEVGFAEAQWGEAEAAPYREALAKAREELRAAFSVRQRLDDAEPETPEQRRAMLQEIVARTGNANALLQEQAQRLAALRDLERTAPDQLAALPPTIESLRARLATATTTMERLGIRYAPAVLASVDGNLAEAAKALASAGEETQRGLAAPEARRRDAVVALRHAQDGVASATGLIEAVERLATRLDDAAARLPAELAAAAADVATARDLVTRRPPAPPGPPPAPPSPAGSPASADPAAALDAAERTLGQARRLAEAVPLDPLAALEHALAANQAADAIVAGIREAEAQRQRRAQLAATAIATAHGRVDRAVDYIRTRRHGVGREARTRVAEAEARLADAERLASTDAEGAMAAAQRATQLADESYRLAASEFGAWDAGNGPVAGPYRAPGASPEAQVIGAVLGGILGGMLSGGRGSGWGGSPWGGPSGGRGGGFGMPGPFGGGGGGRIGGGGFGGGGGGGGRVRGGRW